MATVLDLLNELQADASIFEVTMTGSKDHDSVFGEGGTYREVDYLVESIDGDIVKPFRYQMVVKGGGQTEDAYWRGKHPAKRSRFVGSSQTIRAYLDTAAPEVKVAKLKEYSEEDQWTELEVLISIGDALKRERWMVWMADDGNLTHAPIEEVTSELVAIDPVI